MGDDFEKMKSIIHAMNTYGSNAWDDNGDTVSAYVQNKINDLSGQIRKRKEEEALPHNVATKALQDSLRDLMPEIDQMNYNEIVSTIRTLISN